MTLAEIAMGYREAAEKISARQEFYKAQLLEGADQVTQSKERSLRQLKNDLLSLAELCDRYYERGYWRDARYTSNPPPRGSAGRNRAVAEGRGCGQRRHSGEAQKEPCLGDSAGIDPAATKAAVDAILRQLLPEGDC